MPLETGTTLGKYEILAPLGVGGMGEVYRASDAQLRREVAVKVLRPELADDAERLARFLREARMLAQLNHPNVATIHEIQQEGSLSYLVMEMVPGITLAQRLRGGALTIRETLALARQMADALEAAHARGVIHRDLKPSNIKITPEGRVKLLDFGLAKALESNHPANEDSFQTASLEGQPGHQRSVLGTPAYMSPEQANAKPADQRADVWAFGCILYESLSGRQPFSGETIINTLAAVIGRDPEWQRLPPDLPPRFRALVLRCLAKDPDARPNDMGVVRRELDQVARELAGGALDSDALTQLAQAGGIAPPALVRPQPYSDSRTDPIVPPSLMPTDRYAVDLPSLPVARPPARNSWLGPRWLLPTMLFLALTSAAIYLFKDRFLPIDSVAVLPFGVSSGDQAAYGSWGESMAGHITNRLSQTPNLTVAAQEKVAKVKDLRQISHETAGKRLQVRALVTGGIRTVNQGDEIVMEVALRDTWTDQVILERSFRRKASSDNTSLATWQEQIAKEIAESVLEKMGK